MGSRAVRITASTSFHIRTPFASNDPAFCGISGGVLWLISSPRYGAYRLPPSLIARLHITEVVSNDDQKADRIDPKVKRAGKWIALADRDRSVYLPLNNALDVLRELWFQGRSKKLNKLAILLRISQEWARAGPLRIDEAHLRGQHA